MREITIDAQQKLINVYTELVARVGMTFNATKSTVMIFPPHRTARLGTFPNFTLSGVALCGRQLYLFRSYHLSVNDDNQDIAR